MPRGPTDSALQHFLVNRTMPVVIEGYGQYAGWATVAPDMFAAERRCCVCGASNGTDGPDSARAVGI